MPVHVEYRPIKSGKDWAIIENETGIIKGRSDSKAKAESSSRARAGAKHGWKPTGKKK